jgi:hypothetical protein
MMLKVIESKEVIEIHSLMPIGKRLLFLALAFIPLLAPYELIIRVDWQNYLNLFFLIALLISLGAMVISALLVWGAVAGLSSSLKFDRSSNTIIHSAEAPVVIKRTVQYPFDQLAEIQVYEHEWSDGDSSYSVRATMTDGESLQSGTSWSRAEIEALVQKITAFLRG